MSRFLITFCNTLPQGFALAAYDFDTDELEWIDPPETAEKIGGATGICRIDAGYLVLFQHRIAGWPSTLALYDAGLRLTFAKRLTRVSDAHSMMEFEDGVLVASTGTNDIVRLTLDGAGNVAEEPVWSLREIRSDVDHLNSIAVFDNRLHVSSFGPKRQDGHPREGGVIDTVTGDFAGGTLIQPHSLVVAEDLLHVLESAPGRLWRFRQGGGEMRGEMIAELPGYLRGLQMRGDIAYVGASAERLRSKSKGTLNPAPADTMKALHCLLYRVDLGSGSVESRDLTPFGREIYDLALLPEDSAHPAPGSSRQAMITRQLAYDREHLQALDDLRVLIERYEARPATE